MDKISFRDAVIPEAVEKEKNGLITWGEDNLYPQYLAKLYQDNSIHGGIINQKVKFLTSGGISVENGDASILDNFGGAYNIQEVIEDCALDLEIFNAFAILFKKTSKGWVANHASIELIRCTESLVFFEYSEDWANGSQSDDTNWRKIKNINSVTEEDTECLMYAMRRPKQIKLEKNKKLSKSYYPVPLYNGAITSIMAYIEMSFFTYAEVVNGFKGGTLVSLNNGVPETDEERRKIVESIKQDSSDKTKQGGIVVTFADGSENATTVMQLSGNDLDKRYETTKKLALQDIMIAHSVIQPTLFGLNSDSMFGSREEIEMAYRLFQLNYTSTQQDFIAENINYAERRLNGFSGKIVFNPFELSLEKNVESDSLVAESINGMSPLVVNKVLETLTINEVRRLANLPEIVGGDEIQAPTTEQTAFSKQKSTDEVIAMFAKCGRKKSDFKIKHSESCDFSKTSEEYLSLFRGKFDIDLTDEDRKILKMINDGESYQAVLRALDISAQNLAVKLKVFEDNGLTDGWKLTESALNEIEEVSDFEVLYSYEEKRNAPPLVAGGTSRPFCLQMLGLDRLYTRQEIDLISSQIGRDVWLYRGGWYHNPVTDRNTPSCRHEWRVNIVNVN